LVLLNVVRTNLETLVVHVLWGMNSAMLETQHRAVQNRVKARL
jgi:hypothetical protein